MFMTQYIFTGRDDGGAVMDLWGPAGTELPDCINFWWEFCGGVR